MIQCKTKRKRIYGIFNSTVPLHFDLLMSAIYSFFFFMINPSSLPSGSIVEMMASTEATLASTAEKLESTAGK